MHHHQKRAAHALAIMVVMLCLGLQVQALGQANLGPVALAAQGKTLYVVEARSQQVAVVDTGSNKVIRQFKLPQRLQGVALSPDGKRLYVADTERKITLSYKINRNGTLSDKKLFAAQWSDGITIDAKGNVYLTSDKVNVYNIKGELIDSIQIPELPTNVTFGGKDNQTLFITARTSLYSIRMNTKGIARP